MRKLVALLALFVAASMPMAAAAQAPVPPGEKDLTLQAMHDEMERARTRLSLPGR